MTTLDACIVSDAVDTARYPLLDQGGDGWDAVVAGVRRDLAEVGCSVLPAFVRPDLHETLRREGDAIVPWAYYDVETVNAYNTPLDTSLPDGHPAAVTMERGNAFVARDTIPGDCVIHRLYTSAVFQRFVAECVELPRVHELADPLSGLCVNVLAAGRAHPWHFDTNECTVSMVTREPAGGGVFEYCPNIRSRQAENFDDVAAVLAGSGAHLTRRLTLRAGDLQLFAGRYSLHRVTAVQGPAERHSAIFAYSERPGVVGSLERTRQLFGRVTPIHEAAARDAVRVDRLLD